MALFKTPGNSVLSRTQWFGSVHAHRRACSGFARVGIAILIALLSACEGDIRDVAAEAAPLFGDDSNPSGSSNSGDTALALSTRLVGTSADGSEADLVITWQIDEAAREAVRSSTRIVVVLTSADGEQTVLSRQRIADDETEGEIDLAVPVTDEVADISVGLEGLAEGIVDDLPMFATLTLPSLLSAEDTPLEQLASLHAELQTDSYQSEVEGNRRVHRFAVRVEGQLDGSANTAFVGDNGRVSVTGLDRATSQHFVALEGGVNDLESSVRAVYQEEPVTVFLVMDVSSSISLAGAADDLLDAVSRTLLNLAPVARFDYRVFASDVYEIDSLRDLAFDELTDSGTAFYRALDTALDDVESTSGDVVVIGFTDGRDLASRNFYPAFLSHEQVLEYVQDRLRNVGQARRELSGNRFEAHFVSLGSDVDIDALERLASAGSGSHYPSFSNETIAEAFAHLTNGVRGVYQLEYSSQQLAGDATLILQVQANGISAAPITLPTRAGLAPSD